MRDDENGIRMIASASGAGAPRKLGAGIALGAFALSLLFSVLVPLLSSDGVENPEPFLEALRAKSGALSPGDRVLVHPPWRDDVLDAIDASGLLPRGVEATTALAPRHGEPLSRLLVLADPGAPLPRAWRRAFADATTERIAGIDVIRLERDAAGDGLTLDDRIAEAEVFVEDAKGKRTSCHYSPSADKHLCPGLPEWMYVGPYTLDAKGRSYKCLWSHPISNGRVVTRFKDVRLTEALALSHGLTDRAASNPKGAPVTVAVRVDGEEIGRVTHANRPGFETDRFAVQEPGGLADVEVEVTTPDAGARHFCFSLSLAGGAR